jgi:hypothetical protein
MPRELHDHKTNPANTTLVIYVEDGPGSGGASHMYSITGFNPSSNASCSWAAPHVTVLFQNGPIAEVGVNGVTHEALLAILIDRLRGFQAGTYACRENALALTKLEEALHWLGARTAARVKRGVEGTHAV